MDQLYMSFHEEIFLKLKNTNWEFETKPDSLIATNKKEKFIKLDCSSTDNKTTNLEKENIIKIEF